MPDTVCWRSVPVPSAGGEIGRSDRFEILPGQKLTGFP
jgi:hypothetical protein